jgi:hypothetical protein
MRHTLERGGVCNTGLGRETGRMHLVVSSVARLINDLWRDQLTEHRLQGNDRDNR